MSALRPNEPMCIITLEYVQPLSEVDRHMDAHVAWLDQGFDAGVFVLAGRRKPRTGGIILTRGAKGDAAKLAATDPFVTAGVARSTVVEFRASFAAAAVADLFA